MRKTHKVAKASSIVGDNIGIDDFEFDREKNKLGNGAYGLVFWATIQEKKFAVLYRVTHCEHLPVTNPTPMFA